MKIKNIKKCAGFWATLITVAIVASTLGVSWICTCGVIKLITLCFGWTYSWGIATGIWLLMVLARTVFKNNVTVKK
jgi:hypothetical protein